MYDLFKSECRRFRWWALGVGLLHFGVLAFFDRVIDTLQQPFMVYQLVAATYAVAGALLGLYQAASYRRINQWITLLHRPLAPARIMAAVTGAGAVMLIVMAAVPLILLLVTHGATGARFVDTRQLWFPLAGWLVALIGYLGGVYAILGQRRHAWAALIPALLAVSSEAIGGGALVVQALIALVLAWLVLTAFKPDLDAPPQRAGALAGTALAVAMGVFVVLVVVGDLIFQMGWIATGTDPLNGTAPRGGVVEANRANGGTIMAAGLAARKDAQGQLWRDQIALSEVFSVPADIQALPARGELTNIAPMEFDDERRNIRWTFSHDDMRFHGIAIDTGANAGLLGADDRNVAFASPPLPLGEGRLVGASGIAAFSEDDGRIHQRLSLPAGETIAGAPVKVGDAVAILSDKMLRFYDARVLSDGDKLYPATSALALPAPTGSLIRIDLIELLDGYLVSFASGRGGVNGPQRGWQQVFRVDGNGRATMVGRRDLIPDYPVLARFAGWWISPVLRATREAAEGAFAGPRPLTRREPIEVPRSIHLLAIVLALASAIGAALLARRWRLGLGAGAAWTLATLALGPPMLAGLWLIRPEPRQP